MSAWRLHKMNMNTSADNKGIMGIGYIYTFMISALLMTAITLTTATMIRETSRASVVCEARDVLSRVIDCIEDAIYMGTQHPHATYIKELSLPREIHGVEYEIEATNDAVYVNSTDGYIEIKGKLASSYITISGSVLSSAGLIRVEYMDSTITIK
jgi:hypothetical protein